MKKLSTLLMVLLLLAASVLQAFAVEAKALRRFPVMKTEDSFRRLLELFQKNERKAAAEYLSANGLFMEKGTEVILFVLGCEGQCVKFQVKGDPTDYWTVLTMDGEKVFEYKK